MFGRALRLRWLWFEWTAPDRPWVGTVLPCDVTDRQLFRVSTIVTVGNGRKAKFWQSSWLQGKAPMDIAPRLYKLAWRKNRTVREELEGDNWTRGLWRMQDADTIAEFVHLLHLLMQVQLTDQEDTIVWKWTANGQFSARSAYEIQCQGAHCHFDAKAIWKAKSEGKHKFFMWLAVQNRVLTADKLIKRNWQCNPICSLCDQEQETVSHLCLHCPYAKEVWHEVNTWRQETIYTDAEPTQSFRDWWNDCMKSITAGGKREKAAVIMYTAWNIWKERNRRIFQHQQMQPRQVFFMIKEEMRLRELAYADRSSEQAVDWELARS